MASKEYAQLIGLIYDLSEKVERLEANAVEVKTINKDVATQSQVLQLNARILNLATTLFITIFFFFLYVICNM